MLESGRGQGGIKQGRRSVKDQHVHVYMYCACVCMHVCVPV